MGPATMKGNSDWGLLYQAEDTCLLASRPRACRCRRFLLLISPISDTPLPSSLSSYLLYLALPPSSLNSTMLPYPCIGANTIVRHSTSLSEPIFPHVQDISTPTHQISRRHDVWLDPIVSCGPPRTEK